MGYAIDDSFWQYREITRQDAPEIEFEFPFVPRLAVYPMSVLIAFRFVVLTYAHTIWLL